jgi:UDP-N-acetylmuramate--alanine ligase
MTGDVNADRAVARARAALGRPSSPFRELPQRLLLVDVPRQRLDLIVDGTMVAEIEVSTAAAGVGGEAGSLRTPPGWHRIHARIGADQPLGAVFESRVPTGVIWSGETRDDDLILTRVLTLEGLEPGINQGPGHDSLERYIYLHGTNHEDHLGTPASHGCVRLSNPDIAWLFDHVEVGDPVVVVGDEGRSAYPDPLGHERFHFAGIGGSGMSALAQFQVMAGGRVSGSDRAFDRGERGELERRLRQLGIGIHAQDGSGVRGDCAALVLSTAVESEVPDYAVARELGVPTLHRSELLAHFVATYRTAAIAGTSGKSTVVGMTFAVLRGAGQRPSLITGGELLELQRQDLIGNAFSDPGSELLVIEADESDGSLVHYQPAVGAVLNLQKDHKEMSEVEVLFERFRRQSSQGFVTGEDANLEALAKGASEIFGFGPRASVRGEAVELAADGSRFSVHGVAFTLPCPGMHNVANALAAIAVCRTLGVDLGAMVEPLAHFAGVARRFHSLGSARGIEVIDDFAHNPAKLKAAIATARARGRRVLAVYQPHGFGPTRFLRPDLVEAFAEALGGEDRLWLLEVFYAGGTARRDFSASEIVDELRERGVDARFTHRERLAGEILAQAREGDVVLVMGARDPSLTGLARGVLEGLASGAGTPTSSR